MLLKGQQWLFKIDEQTKPAPQRKLTIGLATWPVALCPETSGLTWHHSILNHLIQTTVIRSPGLRDFPCLHTKSTETWNRNYRCNSFGGLSSVHILASTLWIQILDSVNSLHTGPCGTAAHEMNFWSCAQNEEETPPCIVETDFFSVLESRNWVLKTSFSLHSDEVQKRTSWTKNGKEHQEGFSPPFPKLCRF